MQDVLIFSFSRQLKKLAPLLVAGLLFTGIPAVGQIAEGTLPADDLKKMSLEELMNLEVTSVSRQPEKLTEVASAIQVITQEDIQRSGATNLTEALRLATNLQVAQLNSFASIISARGFNALYANKLLVLIDGRTVYSPLFAGVFWDAQNVVLEDVARIEVISGPGGTMWGANAVNGVINIITKSAGETQGLYATAAVGTYLNNQGAVRYGGKLGKNTSYRIYGQHSSRDHTFLPDGTESADEWRVSQGGFRIDRALSEESSLMVQGNFYGGREETLPVSTTLDGQNVLGKWTRNFSNSQLAVQAYFDRTWRRMPTIGFELKTYDLEIDYLFTSGKRHSFIIGAGYRFMQDETHNYTTAAGILPEYRRIDLYNAFIQDEITVVPEVLKFTVGTKILHNIFTGFEFQPGARLAFTPGGPHTIWSAVSRSVRTPSRIDVDYFIPTTPLPPDQPHVAGGPNFISEKVIAYELGYRVQPNHRINLSLATFYNQYNDLYSVDPLPGTQIYQIQNGTEGTSWGAEFSGRYQIMKKWRLRGGYTYFDKDLQNKPGSVFNYAVLGFDAQNQVLIQSIMDLPGNFQFDVTSRYLGELSEEVPDYFTFDLHLAWVVNKWEFSVVGQNLWEDRHKEWGAEIPRSIYGRITCRL